MLTNLFLGVLFFILRKARESAGPNITQNGMIILLITVYVSAVLPAIKDFPYSFPDSSFT